MQETTASCNCAFSWASSAAESAPILNVICLQPPSHYSSNIRSMAAIPETCSRGLSVTLTWGHACVDAWLPCWCRGGAPNKAMVARASSPRKLLLSPPAPTSPLFIPAYQLHGSSFVPTSSTPPFKMPTTLKEFESVWPRIRADLEEHCKQYKLPQQSLDWFSKVRNRRRVYPKFSFLSSPSTTTPLAENVIVACR